MERQRCEDGGLGCRIMAINVGGGIGFDIPQTLCLGEHVVVGGSSRVHGVQDEVGGAVNNALD